MHEHIFWALHHVGFHFLPASGEVFGTLGFLVGVLFLLPHHRSLTEAFLNLTAFFEEFLSFLVFSKLVLHAFLLLWGAFHSFLFHLWGLFHAAFEPVNSVLEQHWWAFHHEEFDAHHLHLQTAF